MRLAATVSLTAGLALLAPGAARAQATYKIQSIVKLGDTAGDIVIKKSNGDFEIGALDDNGQLIFVTENAAGGEVLIQYADGKFTTIAALGNDAPGGKWGSNGELGFAFQVSMNRLGNAVFAAHATIAGKQDLATFLWDAQTRKVTLVAQKGMPAVNGLVFQQGGDYYPAINNNGDIALVARVKNAAGQAMNGIFFLGRDGKLLPVVLPDQVLPDGKKVDWALNPTVNDAGIVAFVAMRHGESQLSAYLWEQNGTITPVAGVDADAPGGGKFTNVPRIFVNDKNGSALLVAQLKGSVYGLYRFTDGRLVPVVVTGHEMPDGGKLKSLDLTGMSFANELGQHAFVATLEDGTRAAYLVDADGKLSLVLKSGAATELGTITQVGTAGTSSPSLGVGLNSKGQVAVPARLPGGVAAILLLTPVSP